MHFASYDWRLSFSNLEVRDSYFTKLKNTIELSKKQTGLKVVVITHSMGKRRKKKCIHFTSLNAIFRWHNVSLLLKVG